jgi:hypothetical protein
MLLVSMSMILDILIQKDLDQGLILTQVSSTDLAFVG